MRILVLSHMYPTPYNETHGIFVHQQARALLEEGLALEVISPRPWVPFPLSRIPGKWQRWASLPRQGEWEGIRVHYPRYREYPRKLSFATSGKRLYSGIRDIVSKLHRENPFDLVHAHVALPDGWAGTRLAAGLKLPCLITVHGQDLQHTIHKGSACRKALEESFQGASPVVFVSTKLKREGERLFPHLAHNYHVVPNGIDPGALFRGESPIREERKGRIILLSVANLIHTKGIDLNLHALKELKGRYPNLYYIVVGKGPQGEKLQSLARSLGLADRVEFAGAVPHRKAMEYMAACHIFSLPSWSEGFGIAYIEAMAHGKPVIACRGEGISDLLEDGENGLLVEPQRVDSLVEALDYLLRHEEKAKSMGAAARRLVMSRYTWEANAKQMTALYQNPGGKMHT